MAIEGGCLCGAVRYSCAEESGGGHCHCDDCRKTSGTGHGSHMIVPEAAFTLSGDVRFFDKAADSGDRDHVCHALAALHRRGPLHYDAIRIEDLALRQMILDISATWPTSEQD